MGRRLRKCKSIGVIFVLLLVFPSLSGGEPETGSLSIDYAYLRRPVPKFDPGTIHMFLRNQGPKPITVTRIYVNDIPLPSEITIGESGIWEGVLPQGLPPPMEEKLDDRFIWHQVLPNPIPPGKVADVMVKLAYATQQLIKIEVETADGQRLHRVIQPIDNPFRITFIGFSDELDKVYIYLENNENKALTVSKVFLNTEDITSLCSIPWEDIPPGRKRCIVARLKKPLTQGEYIAIRVSCSHEDVINAQAVVRVFSFFPIVGGSGRGDLRFDPQEFTISYPSAASKFADHGKFGDAVYRVFGDPQYPDAGARNGIVPGPTYPAAYCNRLKINREYAKAGTGYLLAQYPPVDNASLRASARIIISRANTCRDEDPFHPVHIHVGQYRKDLGCFFYGEIVDTFDMNPNANPTPFSSWNQFQGKIGKSAQLLTQLAKKASEPRPFYTVAETYQDNNQTGLRPIQFNRNRWPTPDEERLLVYCAISRGSKGIFYRDASSPSYPEMEREIERINKELRILRQFLKVGEPVTLAEVNDPKVEANTILSGEEAIILILINHDYNVTFEKADKPFTYTSKKGLVVRVRTPRWMKIKDVYDVGQEYERIKYTNEGYHILIPIKKLGLTAQILLVTNNDDCHQD